MSAEVYTEEDAVSYVRKVKNPSTCPHTPGCPCQSWGFDPLCGQGMGSHGVGDLVIGGIIVTIVYGTMRQAVFDVALVAQMQLLIVLGLEQVWGEEDWGSSEQHGLRFCPASCLPVSIKGTKL